MQYLGAISKTTEWSLFISRQTIQYHSNPSLCPANNAEEAEVEQFYEDLQDLLELTPPKDVLFIIGDWNAKVQSQEIPGITGKFGLREQNEAGQSLTVLPREYTGHGKHPLPTTQGKTVHMDITRWSIRLIIFFAAKDGETIQSAKNKTRSWLWLRSWTPYGQIQT